MLLFPKLKLQDGKCWFPDSADRNLLFEDPVEMAQMLRVMNARSILVVDESQTASGSEASWKSIAAIAGNVDIPIQLDAGRADASLVRRAIEIGVYRCIAEVANRNDATDACKLIGEFGAQRISVRFPSELCLGEENGITDLLATLADSKCSRIILSLAENGSWRNDETLVNKFEIIAASKKPRGYRITIDGGVQNSEDLLRLNDVAPAAVDSVAVFEPFFAARFPCQAFWCWKHKGGLDLSRFSTASLKTTDNRL